MSQLDRYRKLLVFRKKRWRMLAYVFRRILVMIPVLLIISVICFIIVELPPGDFLTSYIAQLVESGERIEQTQVAALMKLYGLDQPVYIRYLKWIWAFLHGQFGYSYRWHKPVRELIEMRLLWTILIASSALLFSWAVGIPIGIFSATHQYSVRDHIFTFFGFLGLAIPNFLLALILMFIAYAYFGISIGGLFSTQYNIEVAWSWPRFVDLLQHIWIPIIVVGTAGTAQLIRVMRGNLLDELHKNYVITARAKGVSERRLLFKYPVRLAINPFISTIGWSIPQTISRTTLTAIVLGLPTTGPLLLGALITQDTYLSGAIIMLLSFMTVVGTLFSDILLAWVDPRIRYKKGVK